LNPQQVYQDSINRLTELYPYYKFTLHYDFYQIDDPDLDVGTICDRALMALNSVKNSYSEHFAWYDSSMRNKIVEEQELTSIMQESLDQKRFLIYFQPQYNYATGELSGAEALVRFQHPTKGLIMPGEFIPVFEKNGFIFELDKYVWDQTFAQIREWLDAGLKPPIISMNISRRDVYHPQLVSIFEDLVKKYQLDPKLIGLEITESSYMSSPEQLLAIISQLQKIGFRLEMDDFGSGYSSLNTLKDLPVNVLKLDLKFIAQSSYNSRGGKILSSVVHMAHMLNLPVIAEGVETRQQADYLKSVGCYLMQGYYFSKPVPTADFTGLLQNSKISQNMRFHFDSTVDNSADFLDYSTQTTLLFNSFVGGAAIIEYQGDQVIPIRLNDNFLKTLGLTLKEIEDQSWAFDYLSPESKPVFSKMLDQALDTSLETNCQTQLIFPGHQEPIWTSQPGQITG
jgi:EAL domain-containing protein (putative c-di-GMP-specific phosphodiesterase class I)